MDCSKAGRVIYTLRKEKGLTQKQLADALGLSDRTISKWERGLGCPDVSLWEELSLLLGVQIKTILAGELPADRKEGGNMKRSQFFVCPHCGNVLFSTGKADMTCCGRLLSPLKANTPEGSHLPQIQEVEDEWVVTFDHPMTKEHFLSFVACVSWDRVLLVKTYPEQEALVRFMPLRRGCELFYYCTQDGLFRLKP